MDPLLPGDPRTVGEFRLRGRLGAGGMGRVYLGYSPAGRAVAVKVVRPELAEDAEFSRRFAREVDAARAVGGMYTTPVVAAGLDDDPPWLATAYVPGPSLEALVKRHGPLSPEAVWRLAAGVTEALGAVHACELVHRDLKPANVLVAQDGPHLIDFGISRALHGTSLTQTGMVIGTPGYMSPEQAESGEAGPPSDVFSLGALLAFAATGKEPFGLGSAAAVLYRVVSGEPDISGVPEPLRGVIAACMAKVPGRRPDLPTLSGMIAKHGPGLSFASATTAFWPPEVAARVDEWHMQPATGGSAAHSSDGSPGAGAGVKTLPVPEHAYYPPPAQPAYPPAPARNAPYNPYPPPPAPTWYAPMPGATWLMRLGAAVTLANVIATLASISQLKAAAMAHHPMSATAARDIANGAAGAAVFGGAVSIALWLWLARAARRGRRWVRPTGTALFGFSTVVTIATFKTTGIPVTRDLNVVVWIIALLAVVTMWARRPK